MADTDVLYIPGFGVVDDIIGQEININTIIGDADNTIIDFNATNIISILEGLIPNTPVNTIINASINAIETNISSITTLLNTTGSPLL